MMHDGMGSMMAWMMGIGLAGWVLVIALLVTIVFLLVRLLADAERRDETSPPRRSGRSKAP